MRMGNATIKAAQFAAPTVAIVESAESVARLVVGAMDTHDTVTVSLEGLPPVSSSFFNLILKRVVDHAGVEALDRVQFDGASELMSVIIDRSRQAVRNLAVA